MTPVGRPFVLRGAHALPHNPLDNARNSCNDSGMNGVVVPQRIAGYTNVAMTARLGEVREVEVIPERMWAEIRWMIRAAECGLDWGTMH